MELPDEGPDGAPDARRTGRPAVPTRCMGYARVCPALDSALPPAMELDMSDTSKVIAPPEELEAAEQPAAEAVERAETAEAGVEAQAGPVREEGDAAPSNALDTLRRARDQRGTVEGRVFGWNPGG